MVEAPRGARVRPDPHRRERIARAAISVVAERGVEGLTHRAVAAMAEVPLGSTTYHFQTLDDLLEEALRHAAEDNIRALRDWREGLADDVDPIEALTSLIVRSLREGRVGTIVEYDLYVAALHRPRLRPIGAAWDDALGEVFASLTDALTGQVLAALFCGLLMQGAIADPMLDEARVGAVLRRAVEEP